MSPAPPEPVAEVTPPSPPAAEQHQPPPAGEAGSAFKAYEPAPGEERAG